VAVTASWYGNALLGQYSGTAGRRIDWDAASVFVELTDNTHTINKDTHDFQDDVDTDEITGTGYTASGVAITTSAVTLDSGTDEVRLDATDAQWTSASFTARNAHVYAELGGANSANPLLSYVDFGGDETVSSGTFTIQWDATGVMKLDYT
jgi:hypothetical protein